MKITIAKKIAVPFLVILLLLVGMISTTYQGFKRVSIALDNIELESVKRGAAGNLRFNITQLLMASNDYVITQKQYYQREFDRINLVVDNYYHEFNQLPLTDEEPRLLKLIKQDLDSIRAYSAQIFSIPNPRLSPKAWALMETMDYRFGGEVNKKTTQIFEGVSKRVEKYRLQAAEVKENTTKLIFGGALVGILITIIVTFLTVNRISKPIIAVAKSADSLANGDYSLRVVVRTNDEVALLAKSFNVMAESIQQSQKTLKESKRLTEAIISTVPVGLLVFDTNGKILNVNNAFCKGFGLEQNLLTGQNIIPMFEKLKAPEECRHHILTRKPLCDIECNYLDAAKGARILNLTLNPMLLNEGESLLIVEDITKRKHDEEIVINNEKHFRALIENSADGLCVISPDGHILYDSPSNKNISGYEQNEFIGKSILTLFHTDDLSAVNGLLADLQEEPSELAAAEVRCIHKDGTWRWIEITAKSSLQNAAIAGIVINFHDITERKQIEKELGLERGLFIGGPTVVFKWRNESGWPIEYVSPNVQSQFGYEQKNLTSGEIPYASLVHPDDLNRIAKEVMNHTKSGVSSFEQNYRLLHSNGEYRWIYDFTNIIRNSNNEVTHYHGTIIDITERKQAEESLRDSEEKFRNLVENISDVFYVSDQQGKFLYCSPNFFTISGYSPQDIYGNSFIRVIAPIDRRQVVDYYLEQTAKGSLDSMIEFRFIQKDGSIIWVEQNTRIVRDSNGKIVQFRNVARDITERKQAEKSLRDSEEKFRLIAENTADTIAVFDLDLHCTYVSPSIIKLRGYTAIEAIAQPLDQVLTPESLQKVNKIFTDQMSLEVSGKANPSMTALLELEEYCKNGSNIWVELATSLLRDDKLTPTGILTITRDITGRKKLETSILQQLNFTIALNEIANAIISSEDSSAILEKTTDLLGETLGVDRCLIYDVNFTTNQLTAFSERINPNYSDIQPTKGVYPIDIFISGITEMKKTKQYLASHFDSINPVLLKDHSDKILQEQMNIKSALWYPFAFYPDGYHLLVLNETHKKREWTKEEIDFLNSVSQQISIALEKIRLLEARKHSEEEIKMLATALKRINECVSITDVENTILFVNEAFLKTYGYSEEEVLGQNIKIVGSQKSPHKAVEEVLPATLQGGWNGELFNKRKDGSEFPIYLSTTVIEKKDGEPNYLIGIAIDITERKRAEQELIEAKEKAEEMNRLKSNFLSNMSHELRTPLNGILGYAEVLSSSLEDEEFAKMSQTIHDSGTRLSETLNLILDLSKAETEKNDILAKNISILPIVQKVTKHFSEDAAKKNLQMEIIIPDENIIANLDANLFERAVSNLVNNAVKFTNRGKITVEAGSEKGFAFIKIKDTGIGIPDDKIELIWEEFRQVSEGISRSYEGTGLGLTISKRIIELMGGTITVESKIGIGSLFTVKFPSVSLPEIDEMKPAEEMITRKDKTKKGTLPAFTSILYVEDDLINQNVMKLYLRNLYRLETAKDGKSALQLVVEKKFDLILMDINLGGAMDGMAVTKEIRKMSQYADTPIIAVTAYAMDSDRKEFLSGGCSHYLVKPFEKHQLLELLAGITIKTK